MLKVGRVSVYVLSVVTAVLLFPLQASAGQDACYQLKGNSDALIVTNLSGEIQVANKPAGAWDIDLYSTGLTQAKHISSTTSGKEGSFSFPPFNPSPGSVVYAVAKNGSENAMLAVLGQPGELPCSFVINELVTVASVWTSAQFINGEMIRGNSVGLASAARNVPNLVNLQNGGLGDVVQAPPNGFHTTTMATLNTLASMLADCLRDGCGGLFALANPPGSDPATNTLQALLYVALNPWHNVNEIFYLRPPAEDGDKEFNPVFIPTLLWPPTAWTLSLVYTGGGFNAPGGFSIDAQGNLWSNNNFIPGSQSILANTGGVQHMGPLSYSGTGVTKLSSNGRALSPPTGFLGGGTFGAAFGMAIDRDGNAWVGNFAGDSLTKLAPDGSPISPDSDSAYSSSGGYRHESFDAPQSTIVDIEGNVWTSNLMGNTVTEFVKGNPGIVRVFGGENCTEHDFSKPWGLAAGAGGKIWVTNFLNNSVSVIDQVVDTSCPVATYPLGETDALGGPEGIAIDSMGNVWVARTGASRVTLLEAATGYTDPVVLDAHRTMFGPWGIAVDGKDNVWVADFFGKRVTQLCGLAGNCPQGVQPGEPISPVGNLEDQGVIRDGGYGANGGLQSITSVVIDQAGNVWLANNFDNDHVCLQGAGIPPAGTRNTPGLERLQTMCGGNGAVVMFGVAAPVAAPLIGPPVQP